MSGHSAAVPSKPRVISWRNRVSRGEPPPFPRPGPGSRPPAPAALERQARGGERRASVVGDRAAHRGTGAPNDLSLSRIGALHRARDRTDTTDLPTFACRSALNTGKAA